MLSPVLPFNHFNAKIQLYYLDSILLIQKEHTMNYTYILRCSDNTLYCGWTNDLKKRLASHNAGTGAKYTRPRTPVTLVYYETFETKEEAMSREFAIKRLTRKEKLDLINNAPLSQI